MSYGESWEDFDLAVKGGRKIEAIKILRSVSGLGLKESKDAVELYEANKDKGPFVKYFHTLASAPGCQLAFENGTVVYMPATKEVKIDAILTVTEWTHLKRILAAIDPNWS